MYLRRHAAGRTTTRSRSRPPPERSARTITSETECTVDMGRARVQSAGVSRRGPTTVAASSIAGGRTWRFQHVQVGNPQCAIRVADEHELNSLDLRAIGPEIEHHELFPNRTNVSWFTELGPGRIRARIFERGVGETSRERHRRDRRRGGARARRRPVAGRRRARRRRARRRGRPTTWAINLTGWAVPVFRGTLAETSSRSCMRSSRRLEPNPAVPVRRARAQGRRQARGRRRRDQPRDRRSRHADVSRRSSRPRSEAVADPGTHQYPTNRGRQEFREAVAAFYERRFGVELDPETEVMPAIGAKECIFNLNLAFLDPGDVALASDPGYPSTPAARCSAGGRAGADAARCPSAASRPISTRSRQPTATAPADVPQLPEQPHRRDRARRAVRARSSSSRARTRSSSCTTTRTARRRTTATSPRRSCRRRAPRRSASRCSRCRRATT